VRRTSDFSTQLTGLLIVLVLMAGCASLGPGQTQEIKPLNLLILMLNLMLLVLHKVYFRDKLLKKVFFLLTSKRKPMLLVEFLQILIYRLPLVEFLLVHKQCLQA